MLVRLMFAMKRRLGKFYSTVASEVESGLDSMGVEKTPSPKDKADDDGSPDTVTYEEPTRVAPMSRETFNNV